MIFQGTLQLQSTESVARETLKLRFSVPDAAALGTQTPLTGPLPFTAGQFLSLGFTAKAWRAYSIASTPTEELIEFVVRLVEGGVASEIFRTAQPGQTFPFKGPFGHFVLSDNPEAKLVFCGTGTGIAPFRAMAMTEAQTPTPRPMTLLYGGRNADDIAYLDEVQSWAEPLEIKLGLSRLDQNGTLTNGLSYENCRITQFLEEMKIEPRHEFYICGNGDMVKSVSSLLETQGVSPENIFLERFN